MPEVTGSGSSLADAFRQAIAQASLGSARPSYRLRSPAAQYRQLSRTRLGRQALEQAGVRPSARTRARWLGRVQRPSRGNTDAIRRAYGAMQQGGVPGWVKRGEMKITGSVGHGADVRDRGAAGMAPLLVDLGKGGGLPSNRDARRDRWDDVEEGLAEDVDDAELDELLGEVVAGDIEDSYPWDFPGGAYTVVISG